MSGESLLNNELPVASYQLEKGFRRQLKPTIMRMSISHVLLNCG